jgi:hypothetical protein
MASLLEAVTTTGLGPVVSLRSSRARDEIGLQVDITGGTATVQVFGRLAKRMPWVLLQTINSSGIVPVARVAEVQANVSAVSGATINAEVFIDE